MNVFALNESVQKYLQENEIEDVPYLIFKIASHIICF